MTGIPKYYIQIITIKKTTNLSLNTPLHFVTKLSPLTRVMPGVFPVSAEGLDGNTKAELDLFLTRTAFSTNFFSIEIPVADFQADTADLYLIKALVYFWEDNTPMALA